MEDAREAFKNEPEVLIVLEERIRSQIQLRSLICTQGLTIGHLDSVEEIKALPVKQECLLEQDEVLAAAVGAFRLGHLLMQPPLRPLASLHQTSAIPNIGGVDAYSFEAASQANVLLVRGSRNGTFASVEIPSGRTLATIPKVEAASYHQTSVSPNGRLAAVDMRSAGVMFLDMERGSKLWETKRFNGFFAWMPDVRAVLVRDANSGSPMLLDLETGRMEKYASAPKNLSWVTPANEKAALWLGSERAIFRVEHVRTKGGVQATVTKEFRLSKTSGITSRPPTLVNQGNTLFFISNRDFGSLDLDTGQESVWNVADFLANRYAKLSETTLLVESYSSSGGVEMKTWVLDLVGQTLAPVDTSAVAAARHGLLMAMTGRTGWIRRGHESTHLGDTVSAGAPQPLAELHSAFNLERQMAKIETMERQEREMSERAQLVSQDQKFRPSAAPTAPIYVTPEPAPSPSSIPQAGLPQNAHVEAVGVYQGTGTAGGVSSDGRKMGVVDVRVRRGSAPTILVLSSYEPVQWKIAMDPGARLAGVLLSGYHPSRVTGADAVRVLQMGRTHAYQRGSSEYNALDRQVRSWTGGQGIQIFQGRYEGGSYTVGG